jgi:hypothetical protein
MSGYSREALGLAVNMQQVMERRRLQLAAAKVFDQGLAAKRGDLQRFGQTGRLNRQISVAAVMNAVDTEGREVLKSDAEGYWKDQDRRYFGITEGPRTVTAMRNRLGRVTYRKVYGREGTMEYGNRTDGTDPTTLKELRGAGRTDHTSTENKNITIMVN